MGKHYKHKWTYWVWAAVYFIVAGIFLFGDYNYKPIAFIAVAAFLFCSGREIFRFFKDNKPSDEERR